MSKESQEKQISPEIVASFRAVKGYLMAVTLFSLAVNLLYLVFPLYLIQVFERVMSSRSELTLILLSVIALFALVVQGGLETIRARILTRVGIRIENLLSSRVIRALVDRAKYIARDQHSQALRDFDNVRQFISGSGIHALFDLPWSPIYIAVIFMLSPIVGWLALIGAIIVFLITVVTELLTSKYIKDANSASVANYAFAESSLRNTDVIQSMGMLPGLMKKWQQTRSVVLDNQAEASDRAAIMYGATRFMRFALQLSVLGVGAYLAINDRLNPGAMFACLILMGRALAPVEQLVGSWKGMVGAWSSFRRVNELLINVPPEEAPMTLPAPIGLVEVEQLVYIHPGSKKPVIKGLTFRIEPGEMVALIGPSAAGKSTLARLLVGSLRPTAGNARLDGADVFAWGSTDLGRYIGYLPQNIELFAGTIRENIARFSDVEPEAVVHAARDADLHELILRLPDGYQTEVGEQGASLSAGQRQRVGLARALLNNPRLIVLDEPNSNLDSEGEKALMRALATMKAAGATVIVITHRPSLLAHVDKVMVLQNGVIQKFGPSNEVLNQVVARKK